MPLGARLNISTSIFICSEDGLKDTIVPRLEAAGADLNMVHIFESALIRAGRRKTFSLQDDLDMLGNAIDGVGNVAVVFIDALTSYMGKIDSHRTTDVRSVLEPISGFAEQHKVGIEGVTHPPKAAQGNALRAFTGSYAFVAAPRIAHFVTNEPETNRPLLLPVKNNIGPKALGRGYFISTRTVSKGIIAPYVQWDDAPVDYTADQALTANNRNNNAGASLEDAKELLRELLANGPLDANEGAEAARANNISDRTMDRARKDLMVKAARVGGVGEKGGWTSAC
jgi:putative DNA primase/helicase